MPDVPAGVEPDVAGVTDVAADAVEEIVVERSLAERRPAAAQPVDAQPELRSRSTPSPSRRRRPAGGRGAQRVVRPPRARRGRVTRTAGRPEPTSGDAPVAVVVTVPGPAATGPDASPEPALADRPPAVPPQPAPAPVTRPRRSPAGRVSTGRTAGRRAGEPAPPADRPTGGDPV